MSDETKAMQSDSIAAIAAALAKAQGAYSSASKDKTNPHFKSSYADLSSIAEACMPALSANGIAVVQRPNAQGAKVVVTTMLLHSSGEWMAGELELPVSKQDAQGYGSAITYARRYGLAAMAGVVSSDDDGEAAVGRASEPMQRPSSPPAQGARSAPSQASARTAEAPKSTPYEQVKFLAMKHDCDPKALPKVIEGATGKTSRAQLTQDDVARVEQALVDLKAGQGAKPAEVEKF